MILAAGAGGLRRTLARRVAVGRSTGPGHALGLRSIDDRLAIVDHLLQMIDNLCCAIDNLFENCSLFGTLPAPKRPRAGSKVAVQACSLTADDPRKPLDTASQPFLSPCADTAPLTCAQRCLAPAGWSVAGRIVHRFWGVIPIDGATVRPVGPMPPPCTNGAISAGERRQGVVLRPNSWYAGPATGFDGLLRVGRRSGGGRRAIGYEAADRGERFR